MANRVYFAGSAVVIGSTVVQGAQSMGITVNFTLEQAFQMGKLALVDNIITDGEATFSATKNLDGNELMLGIFAGNAGNANDVGTLASTTANITLHSNTSDSDTSVSSGVTTILTGAFLASVGYNFPSDGWCTEEISFVSSAKGFGTATTSAPASTKKSVAYRHHIGVFFGGTEDTTSNYTNASVNTDLARESMFKLGQLSPYYKYANFPFEVTVELTVANTTVDQTQVNLDALPGCAPQAQGSTIKIDVCDVNGSSTDAKYSVTVSGAVLSSVSQDGGDTGGGNASTTYTYTSYNELLVSG
jgi:hypothetical protein